MKGNESGPLFKKFWFWIIAIIVVGGIGSAFNKEKETTVPATTESATPAANTFEQDAAAVEPLESTVPVEIDASSPVEEPLEEVVADEPTDEEWEASYRTIVLNETQSYIELSVKGSLSKDRYNSAVDVVEMYAERVGADHLTDFQKLADLVAANDLNGAKVQFKALGGEDFPELSKDASPINF